MTFVVTVPANTPAGDTVYVLVLPFVDWAWEEEQHVSLTYQGDRTWSGKVSVEEGALVRYVYDRWDERDWSRFKTFREASGDSIEVESRYLLVAPGLEEVRDTVETWNDLRAPAATGAIAGVVTDSETGAPLMDANVSIGGIHIATDYAGRFKLEGVAAAEQRVTAYRNLGDYKPAAATVAVSEGSVAEVRIAMAAAKKVRVDLDVALPANTPPDARIRLVGSVFQTGARPSPQPNMPTMGGDLLLPDLERVGADRARGTLELHEGTYLQYFYTLGSSSRGQEFGSDGRFLYRSLAVGPSGGTRRDRVAAWRSSHVMVTLRVAVPVNTPLGVPVAFNAGPSHWMTRTGASEWTMFLFGFPGQEERYRYILGDDGLCMDGSPGLRDDGLRTLVYPQSDAMIQERVERWRWLPAVEIAGPGELVDVAFRVTVPPSTARDAVVRLLGAQPALESGVAMSRDAGNPWAYRASVRLPAGETVSYGYELSSPPGRSDRSYAVTVKYRQQEVSDWVTDWSGPSAKPAAARPGFITGIYLPDFWSSSFLRLSESAFERIKSFSGGWVVLSSVWHFGQLDPPLVESRPVKAPSVLTPRDDIVAQAAIARKKGLKVVLGAQFNMEMLPGGTQKICATQKREWLEAWLVEAQKLWMWNAAVADEVGADAMVLPGYCFHVFSWMDENDPYTAEFDRKVAALMDKIRGVYGGKLIMSGGRRELDFPGKADLIGVTTYDTGHPDLPYEATVDQWRHAYDTLFKEKVDPIYERWGKPVLFYTVHLPPVPGDPSPTGQETQARRLEAIFQALESRPWVAGTLSWDYSMIDAPLNPSTSGVRSRLAEAVLAKYYGLWGGQQ